MNVKSKKKKRLLKEKKKTTEQENREGIDKAVRAHLDEVLIIKQYDDDWYYSNEYKRKGKK